jgi:hypothetical protein
LHLRKICCLFNWCLTVGQTPRHDLHFRDVGPQIYCPISELMKSHESPTRRHWL